MRTAAANLVHRLPWPSHAARVLLIGSMIVLVAAAVNAAPGVSTEAGPEGPAQTAYAPESGRGPVVILISGQTGPASYQTYASEVARLGYYAVLVDGKDVLNSAIDGLGNLRKTIERAQRSPSALPGKAAVIGFSLGGGGALWHASTMPDLVSMVTAYYPYTRSWTNWDAFVRRFRVPVLVLAAERDRYQSCCLVETMRAMEAAAKGAGANFELVVYPQADHGFNLETGARGEPAGAFRRDDALDAWRRTTEMLRRHHPLP